MPSRSHCYTRLYHGGIRGKDDDPVTESVRRIIHVESSKHYWARGLDGFELMMENINLRHEEEVFKVLDLNLKLETISVPGYRIVEGQVRGVAFGVHILFEGSKVYREYATTCFEIELIRLGQDIIYQHESAESEQFEPLTQAAQSSGD
ncbi:MAG: hypothetical protein IT410_02015 [Candidatus Doudnabacteria bacterium]|nr:hypothetical protein [Candidatus Doudnabacteria bacterium]